MGARQDGDQRTKRINSAGEFSSGEEQVSHEIRNEFKLLLSQLRRCGQGWGFRCSRDWQLDAAVIGSRKSLHLSPRESLAHLTLRRREPSYPKPVLH